MYILLQTRTAWEISGDSNAELFFRSLPQVVDSTDVLSVGTYAALPEVFEKLQRMEDASHLSHRRPYQHTFELNRAEYPNGRAFDFLANDENLEVVRSLCGMLNGGVGKNLFFDHLVAYRLGKPFLPLIDFHDAFIGGTLRLSGHYSDEEVGLFTKALGATAKRIDWKA